MWSDDLEINNCTMDDFNQIRQEINEFWGSERALNLHHPMLVYEFGNSAFVIRESNQVIAYLFGFLSQTGPVAYVHLIGVRQTHRGQGLGQKLYEHFIGFAKAHGCTTLKAITSLGNTDSIAFHKSLGMQMLGKPNEAGIPVVENYSGTGLDNVVFVKPL